MKIREQIGQDSEAVYRLVEAAFGGKAEADLIVALKDSGDNELSLVMEDEGRIIGHILFSRLQAPEGSLALAPVSVSPDRQNSGVGSALIQAGIERAGQLGWRAVFLLGEPDYYVRFGFDVAAAEKFETPYPKAYFMALALDAGYLDGQTGAVIYPSPFLALE
jgi:putative acetyltransferase